jgi:hypothetical protein
MKRQMFGECPVCSSDRLERKLPAVAVFCLIVGGIAVFDLLLQYINDGPHQKEGLAASGFFLGIGFWRWRLGKLKCLECRNRFTKAQAIKLPQN